MQCSSVGLSSCLRHLSVEGLRFESCSCLLTTGPVCHRCAPSCLKSESKLAQPRHYCTTMSPPGHQVRRVTNFAIFFWFLIKRVNCKICLKSAGLHEFSYVFLVGFVLFCLKTGQGYSSYKEMPQLSLSFWARKNWAALPHELLQDWSLNDAFTYLSGRFISNHLFFANKNY